jgi:predicted CXXCH cytochrome family protein
MPSRSIPPKSFKFAQPKVLLLVGGIGVFLAIGFFMGAAHLEENDAFCASCHTEPESTFFSRSQAAPVDLASFHHQDQSTRCIDCHSGDGVTGRVSAMQVGAVDLVAYVTHTAKQPAPLTTPIEDANCLKCHADVPQTRNFSRHFHVFLSRWQSVDPKAATCVSCHGGHVTTGTAKLDFINVSDAKAVCTQCHTAVESGRINLERGG